MVSSIEAIPLTAPAAPIFWPRALVRSPPVSNSNVCPAETKCFPAKAGIQPRRSFRWAPAFAGEQTPLNCAALPML
jgi:hypothetical protein